MFAGVDQYIGPSSVFTPLSAGPHEAAGAAGSAVTNTSNVEAPEPQTRPAKESLLGLQIPPIVAHNQGWTGPRICRYPDTGPYRRTTFEAL